MKRKACETVRGREQKAYGDAVKEGEKDNDVSACRLQITGVEDLIEVNGLEQEEGSPKQVGIDVDRFIVDVNQALKRSGEGAGGFSVAREDILVVLLPAGDLIPLSETSERCVCRRGLGGRLYAGSYDNL